VFGLDIEKIIVLLVIAVVIFGPDQLPKVAQQTGRALRDLRRLADSATKDLREGLGPEFEDFDVSDLHPKNFVRKHLLDGEDFDLDALDPRKFVKKHLMDEPADERHGDPSPYPDDIAVGLLQPGEVPPYDDDAT
jgi:sec-independent protein translocase protein TatB